MMTQHFKIVKYMSKENIVLKNKTAKPFDSTVRYDGIMFPNKYVY